MSRRLDALQIPSPAQLLECVLHIFVWQGQESQCMVGQLSVCRADNQQIFCRTVSKNPHNPLPPHRLASCRAG